MTTETTILNGTTGAHQSADFVLNQLPIELELANPWTISDQELREIAARAASAETKAYIAGVLSGRMQLPVTAASALQEAPVEQAFSALTTAEVILDEMDKAVRAAIRSSLDIGDRDLASDHALHSNWIHQARWYLQKALDYVGRVQAVGKAH